MEKLPRILQVVRYISKGASNPDAGYFSVSEVNEYISSYLERGYELKQAFYLGEVPEAFGMMYLLVRA